MGLHPRRLDEVLDVPRSHLPSLSLVPPTSTLSVPVRSSPSLEPKMRDYGNFRDSSLSCVILNLELFFFDYIDIIIVSDEVSFYIIISTSVKRY